MRKFLIHKDGNGPDEIEIDESYKNPFGVVATRVVCGMIDPETKFYFLDRSELLKYCADTREEAIVLKKQVLESLMLHHKQKYELYNKILKANGYTDYLEVEFYRDRI